MALILVEKQDLLQMINQELTKVVTKMLLPENLNTKEAVKYSGLSKATLENYRRLGKLGQYKIGGTNIYKRTELDKLIATC